MYSIDSNRYWALAALSVALRGLGILSFTGYIAFWVGVIFLQVRYPTPAQIPQAQSASEAMIYSAAYTFTVITLIFLMVGWGLLSLTFYAIGQWISLHIDMEYNTRRVANHADAAQRRRLGIPPARPEDVRFWDEQIAAQRDNPPDAPAPNRTPPSRPVRGESPRYRVQFNRDPAPRAKTPRFNQADDPTDGDRYTYGREGKRNTE